MYIYNSRPGSSQTAAVAATGHKELLVPFKCIYIIHIHIYGMVEGKSGGRLRATITDRQSDDGALFYYICLEYIYI